MLNLEETNNNLKTELSLLQKEKEEKEALNIKNLQEETIIPVEESSTLSEEE